MKNFFKEVMRCVNPIQCGNAPFYDDPTSIGAHIQNKAIHNIEAGQAFITERTLPYWENEAIARMRAHGIAPIPEPDKGKDPEYWLLKWGNIACVAEKDLHGYDWVAQAAVRVLATASRLREAMKSGNVEMVAALSMLLVCAALEGGHMLEFFKLLDVLKKNVDRVNSLHADLDGIEEMKEVAVPFFKKAWEENPTDLIGSVADAFLKWVDDSSDLFPNGKLADIKKETIVAWIKEAGKEERISIPAAARKPGRPKKQQK